jgi:hypothetical protein
VFGRAIAAAWQGSDDELHLRRNTEIDQMASNRERTGQGDLAIIDRIAVAGKAVYLELAHALQRLGKASKLPYGQKTETAEKPVS